MFNTDENPTEKIIMPAKEKSMGDRLRGYFLTGIFVTAPIGITLYIAYAFFTFIDSKVLQTFPELSTILVYQDITLPGLGVLLVFTAFVVIGWFASNILGRFFIRMGEYVLDRIPVIRNLYSALKQIFETITTTQSEAFRDVVMLEYPRKGTWSIGFVTGTSRGEVQERVSNDTINVFVPTTPNPTSGFLLFVPKKDLKFLDMTVEEGIKLVVSAGIITPPYKEDKKKKPAAKKSTAAKKTATPAKKKTAPKKKAAAKTTTTKKATSKKVTVKKTAATKTATKKSAAKKTTKKKDS